jgi:DtxR family Mn-dependent transcriptional regulator
VSADDPTTATVAEEEYLQSLFWLQEAGLPMTGANLSRAMQLSAPTVHEMVGRLERDGYISRAADRAITFTPAGAEHAEGIVRRHRLIERFLTDVLGIPWDEVHEEAERLEHAASAELVERMATALGHPTEDPHGAPIPTALGRVDERRLESIADLPLGASARVVRMSDRDPAFLRYLAARGIRPGAAVRVSAREPFDGPITLAVDHSTHTMGTAVAARVYVEPRSTRRKVRPR